MYNTVYEMENLKKLWNDVFCDNASCSDTSGFAKANIYQSDDAYMIELLTSDINVDTLDINYEDSILHIKAERNAKKADDATKTLLNERTTRALSRSFTLNDKVDVENIKASLSNGVLSLTLPKREEAKAKNINVDVK